MEQRVHRNEQKGRMGEEEHMKHFETMGTLGDTRGLENKGDYWGDLNEILNVKIHGLLRMESENSSPGIQFGLMA